MGLGSDPLDGVVSVLRFVEKGIPLAVAEIHPSFSLLSKSLAGCPEFTLEGGLTGKMSVLAGAPISPGCPRDR